MQTIGKVFGLFGVARCADSATIGRDIANDIFMRGFFVCCAAVAAVTGDAAEFAVFGLDKIFVADKNFFPRFQRG